LQTRIEKEEIEPRANIVKHKRQTNKGSK